MKTDDGQMRHIQTVVGESMNPFVIQAIGEGRLIELCGNNVSLQAGVVGNGLHRILVDVNSIHAFINTPPRFMFRVE